MQGRPCARQRHVDGDQAEQHRDAYPRPRPHPPQQRQRKRAQEHHVLAAHGEDVSETRASEVVALERVDQLVLAEDHAARERRLRCRKAGAE